MTSDAVRVVNISSGFLSKIADRQAAGLDRADILGRPTCAIRNVAQRSTSIGVIPPLASIHISQ